MNDKTTNDLPNNENKVTVERGQIDKLCQNPVIERRRRERHLEAMRGNTNALKSGKYSKLRQVPQHILNYLDYVDELQFSQPLDVIGLMTGIVQSNLKRISLKEHLDLEDGEIGNKQLSRMLRDTFIMAQAIGQFIAIHKVETKDEPFDIREVRNLTNEDRLSALEVVRTALQRLRSGNNQPIEALPS